jgi:meso-butanediol dehydrogenase/(S,S)-butanediol dehydrogenase/diacetyl reductase
MALDHARDGVRINAICPGDVDTPMLNKEAAQRGVNYDEAMVINNSDSPTGRITMPSEIATLAYYLSSDAAAQITGTTIRIDGGNTA